MSEFRRRLMMAQGGALPYDAEVEYLQSGSSKAYIDTGIAYDGTIELEGDLRFNGRSGYAFGLYYKSNGNVRRWALYANNSYLAQPQFGTVTNKSYQFGNNTWHHIIANYGYLTIDGTTNNVGASAFTTDFPVSVFLFCRHLKTDDPSDETGSFLNCSWGKYKIKVNGVLVQNCKPVRKDGVGYFYDSITGNLLGNANSVGAFTYGNDVNT